TIVWTTAFLIAAWIHISRLLIPRPIPGIPYNRLSSLMPWGELVTLGLYNFSTGEVFSWLSLQCLKYQSPVIQLFIPSFSNTHPVVIISDLREVEDIVTKRGNEIDRAPLMHDFFGLLVPNATIGMGTNDRFKKQRRLWNSILSPTFLDSIAAPAIHDTTIKLADLWQRKAKLAEGAAFAFGNDIKMATLDAIWRMAVGTDLGLLGASVECLNRAPMRHSPSKVQFAGPHLPDFYQALSTLLACLDWVMQGISPRMYTWIFRHSPWFLRAEKLKNDVLDREISTARSRRLNGSMRSDAVCALDQVLRQEEALGKTSGDAAGDEALRDELMELLITGHETTASSICWAIKYITDHPTVQDKLRMSLYAAFPCSSPDTIPSSKELTTTSLPYLDAVIAETLRYSRTGPVSFRHAVTDCFILGHRIPAGTPIILVTDGPYNTSATRP
ncbi:cytochrome P450, partial [Lophiotrema nucula]